MARFRVTYRDDTPPAEVSVGAFAQIAAKRRYGVDAVTGRTGKDGEILQPADPEAGLFAVFVEVVGPQAAAEIEAFDAWLIRVEDAEVVDAPADDDEDPQTAEGSNESSLASPPTSASPLLAS